MKRRETYGCLRGIRWACTLRGRPGTYRGALRPITRDARLPALHRGDFRLRSHASFSGISSGSVQRAPRSQVVVPGRRGPVPPGAAVMSRRRGTPRLAPPSGSSPEMPLMSEAGRVHNTDAFCSQAQNELKPALRYERLKAFQVSGLAKPAEEEPATRRKRRAHSARDALRWLLARFGLRTQLRLRSF